MVFKIIQWNIRGYFNNYSNLQLLIKDSNPDIICLQETKCKINQKPIVPKEYTGYFYNPQPNSKQGAAILIKKTIPHKIIDTNLSLNAVGLEINTATKFTIFSLYFCPRESISDNLLELN